MLSTGYKWTVKDTGLPVVKGFFLFLSHHFEAEEGPGTRSLSN